MKQTKRIISLILCLLMLVAAVPVMEANAASSHILDIDWDLIEKVGYKTTSGPCAAFALAYCRSLIDGRSHSYDEYYSDGNCQWGNGNYTTTKADSDTAQGMLRGMYDKLNKNSPVIAHLKPESSQHWVAVVGYQNVSDPNNLSMDNFLMIDSGTRNFKKLYPLSRSYRSYDLHPDHRYAYSKTGESVSGASSAISIPTASIPFNP